MNIALDLVTLANRMQWKDYKAGTSKACNLHQYWNGVLIRRKQGKSDEAAFVATLSSRYSLPENGSKSPADWVAQSNELGKTIAYGKLSGFACAKQAPPRPRRRETMKRMPRRPSIGN